MNSRVKPPPRTDPRRHPQAAHPHVPPLPPRRGARRPRRAPRSPAAGGGPPSPVPSRLFPRPPPRPPAAFQTFRGRRRRRDWRCGGHLHANEAPPPAARRSIGTRGKEHAVRLGRRGESRQKHAENPPKRNPPAARSGLPAPPHPPPPVSPGPSSSSKARAFLLFFLMNPG